MREEARNKNKNAVARGSKEDNLITTREAHYVKLVYS